MPKHQTKLPLKKGSISNVVIFEKEIKHIDFTSSKENEFYDVVINPPKEAFILIARALKGNTYQQESSTSVPTMDSELFCLNYDGKASFVPRKKILSCVKEAKSILDRSKERKIKLAPEVIFNRMVREMTNNYHSMTLRNDKEMSSLISGFVGKYDQSTRYLAKVIFERYLFENKKE
jgi:hypothetical protein